MIDWDSASLYQEFVRFRNHVGFVFDGPLADLPDKRKAGWLGEQGQGIYKTFEWIEVEKDDPQQSFGQIWIVHIRPWKHKQITRHRLFKRKRSSEESFDNIVKDLCLILLDCEYA